jgi:hypothetical protein
LVDVMVFFKLRPATPQILLAIAIIPNLHLVWSTTARLFTENASRSSRPSMNFVKLSGRR